MKRSSNVIKLFNKNLGVDAAAALSDANCDALFLGMEYNASAKSAARFNTISFGNFSGSPGCRGTNFPSR